ncbi:MAG TPA: CO dehydrogenase/acetyl-CoA synthase complex subunit epsilon [Candidatus Syntrophoarchaeum butanivorans]|uniref:Acetyl-CoA decarbonylase/synthase complex subunit epsilon n=1 Tax=Candidatus Syntropharchaeum butanivorans TaxID=1839936 RepID=A0A1F2P2R6_9EURY|nr:MAG: acetyl-CoA decarbonylase/synthase complex epsilon subunit [Candidatus Syntrophoarchaeum butanivorans]RJS72326.1 MAG: CO dehydrogenase/acetyl-CoA synthase complex subunit epsilon [Candidatus Syntrophoarchaeum sp. WYZ-LMO15]HDM35884.1 CO dehydrogenase/acetyl-CoA synthase complex subunit epsilon [Candidatus Syntrophoarchaeum butanivorans]HEC57450.1 CO dehydrogenase/acetyl-CoA synthase complex subunit epsilon [Candidatus Syntrophoarchaeum butanivorans]
MDCNCCSPQSSIPFDVGNIPGPESGRLVTPETIGRLIKSAKRPLLIVGAEILEDRMIERAIAIGKKGVPIAATGPAIRGFVEREYDGEVYYCQLHELTNCLLDPEWKGLDGKGSYDVVVFFGVTYYYASAMLSAIKNFATNPLIRGVSIDRYYHPHARMTFGNYGPKREEEYLRMIDKLIATL